MSNPVSLLHWLEIPLRLGLSIIVGAVVGWERQVKQKPAGLRTHMLVSLSASLFVISSIEINGLQPNVDASSRVIQGIVAGVGFLGAGEIFSRSRSNSQLIKIHGLTSAAAIWVSAALGVAAGLGLWRTTVLGGVLVFLILWGVKKLE